MRKPSQATLSAVTIIEGTQGDVTLTLRRSNTDNSESLSVIVSGDPAALGLNPTLEIPAGKQQVVIELTTVDNEVPQPTKHLPLTFDATGYPLTRSVD